MIMKSIKELEKQITECELYNRILKEMLEPKLLRLKIKAEYLLGIKNEM